MLQKLTIGEYAVQWYKKSGDPEGFTAALLRSFLYGVVIRRPDFVLMAEEVLTDGKRILAVGPECAKNCWWLHYLGAPEGATTPLDWRNEAPFPHAYIAFKRRGKTKVYAWDRTCRDIHMSTDSKLYFLERQGCHGRST
jgi:hypothetical protein